MLTLQKQFNQNQYAMPKYNERTPESQRDVLISAFAFLAFLFLMLYSFISKLG